MIQRFRSWLAVAYNYLSIMGRVLSTLVLLSGLILSGCNSTWFYRPNDKQYLPFHELSVNEPFKIYSNSGNQLHALLISTGAADDKSLIVHFHGNAGNITWTGQRYGWMKGYGYDLLVFDYSGYGQSTGAASPEVMWEDAVTMLDYSLELKQQHPGRWQRIILAGTSLGGNVLLNALADYERREQFDKVFIDSSFLSYKEVAASLVSPYPGAFFVEPVARFIMSDEFAPVNDFPIHLNQPLIVAHCDSDTLISAELGRQIFDQISSENKQWQLLENCAHAQGYSESYPGNRQRLLKALD